MASLDNDVQTRFGAQLLINASNPQNTTNPVLDTVRLTNAENDVVAAFSVFVGVPYLETDATHVLYATEGVLVRLLYMTGQASYADWAAWKKSLKEELALVQGRDRIIPSTESLLTPTREAPGDKPFADRSVFDGHFRPKSPGGSSVSGRDVIGNQ